MGFGKLTSFSDKTESMYLLAGPAVSILKESLRLLFLDKSGCV